MTGYLVHYSGGGDVGSVSRSASETTADLENLKNDGRTYTISVEAQSSQISGESATKGVNLCELSTVFMYKLVLTMHMLYSNVSGAYMCSCTFPQWPPLVLQLVSV